MNYLEIISFVLFVLFISLGYKKENRNLMLFATACLFVSLGGVEYISDFYVGFNEGYYGTKSS
ncbi:hypothetical protein AADZ91_03020 [Colwelliaceae bacterium 6441]